MASIKYLLYMFMCLAPAIHGNYSVESDEVDEIRVLAVYGETTDIVCEADVAVDACQLIHPNGSNFIFPAESGASSCTLTINVTETEEGLWTCQMWRRTSPMVIIQKIDVIIVQRSLSIDLSDVSETIAQTDDEPIVISTATLVCGTIAFLVVFVGLSYWRNRYYTVYYGKTWGDDDSIDSRMKIQADQAVIEAGHHVLIT